MVLAAAGAAIALLATPVGLLETVVASSGLSEVLAAAAPPLGLTARLSMAGFAALLAAGIVGITRRDPQEADGGLDDEERGSRIQGASKMGFAFSKLTALARGRAMPEARSDAPSLRRADAHPDAPSRPPIFASRDFEGVEIFARQGAGRRPLVAHPESEPESVRSVPGFTMPRAPEPLAEDAMPQPAFLRPAASLVETAKEAPEPVEDDETASVIPASDEQWADAMSGDAEAVDRDMMAAPVRMAVTASLAPLPLPTHGLSIAQLTERLERGLALRRRGLPTDAAQVLADMPVVPPVPVRDSVAPDADEALRAALGALRSMAVARQR